MNKHHTGYDSHVDHRHLRKILWSVWYWIGAALILAFLFSLGYFAGQREDHKGGLTEKKEGLSEEIILNQGEKPAKQPTLKKIGGTVINKISQELIEGAEVTGGSKSVKTDKDGKFSLSYDSSGAPAKITVSKKGFITKTLDAAEDTSQIFLTPQGKVFFVSNRDSGKRSIYLSLYDGSGVRELVPRIGKSENFHISLSPHKRYVAFQSTRDGKKYKSTGGDVPFLYLAKADGSNLTKISSFYWIHNVNWSPKGRYLAWAGKENEDDQKNKIAIRDVANGTTVYIGSEGDSYLGTGSFRFSQDDSMIAYSVSSSDSKKKGVYVADGDGRNVRKISDDLTYGLRFNSDNNLLYSTRDSGGSKVVRVWYHDSGVIKDSNEKMNNEKMGVLSPDGTKKAYADYRDGKPNIFIADKSGANEKQLINNGLKATTISNVDWSLDGNYITFTLTKPGETVRYITAANGKGEPQKIVDEYFENRIEGGL